MSAEIKIYQGNQIGGCITVISTKKSNIVIDFGENLPGAGKTANIDFDWKKEKIDAVFFTHYHGDHIGRFIEIPDDVDIYMGETSYNVMLNIREAIKDEEAVTKLKSRYEKGRLIFINRNKPVKIHDDLVVTGYEIDHSAYDAFMYLVEADGTNILHMGDYRDHGHRGHVIKKGKDQNVILDVIKYYVRANGRKVDVLITEGTMMGERYNDERFSEKELLSWATEYFKSNRHIFLKVSSTNADTLASFYQAARANGIPFYANGYVRRQLRVYRNASRKHGGRMYDFLNTKPIRFMSESDNDAAYKELDKMREDGFVMITNEYPHYEDLMDELSDVNPKMIYSMWEGYIDSNKDAYNEELDRFCRKYNSFTKHTSGHAYPELIAEVIKAVNPVKQIIPIHTENAEGFRWLNISEDLKNKIKYDAGLLV